MPSSWRGAAGSARGAFLWRVALIMSSILFVIELSLSLSFVFLCEILGAERLDTATQLLLLVQAIAARGRSEEGSVTAIISTAVETSVLSPMMVSSTLHARAH